MCAQIIVAASNKLRWFFVVLSFDITLDNDDTSETSFSPIVPFGSAARTNAVLFSRSSVLSFLLRLWWESIGMCSRLIIHNLTRASSGTRPQAACRSIVHCREFLCEAMTCCRKWNSDGRARDLDDSAKSDFVRSLIVRASCFTLPHCVRYQTLRPKRIVLSEAAREVSPWSRFHFFWWWKCGKSKQ